MEHLTGHNSEGYKKLPDDVLNLLAELKAPQRLIAHLTLVHDTALTLTDMLNKLFPKLNFDRNTVLYGAALHDIGKTIITAELSAPGSLHEEAGYHLLRERGIDERVALLARDHSNWENNRRTENLLAALADNLWKGKRVPVLESLILEKILIDSGEERWVVFMALDEAFEQIASTADERIGYQFSYHI